MTGLFGGLKMIMTLNNFDPSRPAFSIETKKTALLVLGERSFSFMIESAYNNKVDSMFVIPCSSLLRA